MTAELKEAIAKVEKLEDNQQRHIAKLIEEEIQWEIAFSDTGSLSNLASEALSEYKSGKTQQNDW